VLADTSRQSGFVEARPEICEVGAEVNQASYLTASGTLPAGGGEEKLGHVVAVAALPMLSPDHERPDHGSP